LHVHAAKPLGHGIASNRIVKRADQHVCLVCLRPHTKKQEFAECINKRITNGGLLKFHLRNHPLSSHLRPIEVLPTSIVGHPISSDHRHWETPVALIINLTAISQT
jgi:hypothetical protein